MEENEKVIFGFKGFDKGMKCRGFQFEVGREYEEDDAVICEKGFHFCENPLDVLNYYDLCESEFAEVASSGNTYRCNDDSKIATTKIKINTKLSLSGFIKASVDFLFATTKEISQLAASGDSSQLAASGDYSQLAASGDSSKLAASGDSSKLAASGHSSQLEISGNDSVGAAIGIHNTIKGVKGNWITLAEWELDANKNRYVPVCVKSAQVDGKTIKENTFYQLKNGKFVAVE